MADSFYESLAARGVTRRSFLAFCGTIAATMGIKGITGADVAEAIETKLIGSASGSLAPVIWMELGSCTGCTESFAQSDDPDPATLLLEYIALNYSETLSAGAGHSLEEAREETIDGAPGGYVVVIEGAVMTRWDGEALRIAGEPTCAPGDSPLIKTCRSAYAVIAAGSCAVDGGFCAAYPNPGGAEGIQKYLKDNGVEVPVINVPSCPVNPATLVALIVQLLMTGSMPTLNELNMPTTYFSQTIHDNCPRRGHFENGEFVYKFGSEEEEKGYCLYAVGCKGPQTSSNCAQVRWNRRVNWCVDAGAPCIGCASADPRVTQRNWVDNNGPFLSRLKTLRLGDIRFNPTPVALGITGIIAVVLVVHGLGMKAAGRTNGGPEYEKERAWFEKRGLTSGDDWKKQSHGGAQGGAGQNNGEHPAADEDEIELEPVVDEAEETATNNAKGGE